MSVFETECRCGAVALRVSGEPLVQLFCHCDDCQSAHAGAYVRAAVYPAAAVEVTRGEPTPFVVKSTPRWRCGACATPLFADLAGASLRSLNAYLMPQGEFRPQFHVQCQHAVLPVVDALPHYKGFPPAFGGRDEFVAW